MICMRANIILMSLTNQRQIREKKKRGSKKQVEKTKRSVVGSNKIKYYTLEKEKKTHRCNQISTYVVVNVSRPMNVTNDLFVE